MIMMDEEVRWEDEEMRDEGIEGRGGARVRMEG